MPVLSTEDRLNVRNYKYHGGDSSPVYQYVLSPFAQFCVDNFTPMWMAPNLVTLTGLFVAVIATVLTLIYNPMLTSVGPRWLHLVTGASIFLYQTLDNMDGKQARRTGSSSALGMLFDHGCDAINACLTAISMSSVLGTGWTYKMFLPLCCGFIPFYFQTWEEYYLGAMVLPPFNGPTEGLLICVTSCFFTYAYGTEWFQTAEIVLPTKFLLESPMLSSLSIPASLSNAVVTPMQIGMTICLAATFITMCAQVSKVMWVLRSKKQGLLKPLLDLLPFVVFFPSVFVWFTQSEVALALHPLLSMLFVSAVFVDMVTHLMLMHICQGAVKPFERYGAFICGMLALYVHYKPAGLYNAQHEVYAIFVLAALFTMRTSITIVRVCQEVAETLDIFVLKLGKRHSRD